MPQCIFGGPRVQNRKVSSGTCVIISIYGMIEAYYERALLKSKNLVLNIFNLHWKSLSASFLTNSCICVKYVSFVLFSQPLIRMKLATLDSSPKYKEAKSSTVALVVLRRFFILRFSLNTCMKYGLLPMTIGSLFVPNCNRKMS